MQHQLDKVRMDMQLSSCHDMHPIWLRAEPAMQGKTRWAGKVAVQHQG